MNFVLVALGKIPGYLNDCISQIKKTQKKSKIFLLVNKDSGYVNKNCKIIFVENLIKSNEHVAFIKKSKLAKDSYRDFFWKHSIERLYYIDNFLNKTNLKNIFHIENDVLLFQNLSLLLSKIKNHNFACVRDGINRVIGSLIYIKNKKVSKKIVQISNKYLNQNDMKILSHLDNKIANSINLPLGEDLNFIRKSKNYKTIKKIPFIFDAAAIGQYIDGPHRRKFINRILPGIKSFFEKNDGFINTETNLKIFNWKIKWKNKRPYKEENFKLIPIANLHIHSKNLKKFMID
tara:strand:+ start:58 stop:927 length:870 start_codon:yes stop_codon:yes gene_type:complete